METAVDQFMCAKCALVVGSAKVLKVHQVKGCGVTKLRIIKCQCGVQFSSYQLFWNHLKHRHQVDLRIEETKVPSEAAFKEYKSAIEDEGVCKYTKPRGVDREIVVFECYRSGVRLPSKGTGKRPEQSQKSNKIGFTCPSVLIKEKDGDGFRVIYHKSHYGHSMEVGKLTREETSLFVAENLEVEPLKNSIPREDQGIDHSITASSSISSRRFKFVCRACLVKDCASNMRSLDDDARDLLFECTSIWVSPTDKYSQKLCAKCWTKCKSWSQFKKLVQDSDRLVKLETEQMESDENGVDILMMKEEPIQKDSNLELGWEGVLMDNIGNTVNIKEEKLNDEEIITVKEEPVDYLEGYSLAPEDEESELAVPFICDADNQQKEEERTSSREMLSEITQNHLKCGHCAKTFSDSSDLNQHKVTHSTDKPFSCDKCGGKFRSKEYLRRHKLIHSDVRAIQCGQCGQKFRQKSELVIHSQSHTLNKPFKCGVCENKFGYRTNWVRHMKTFH